MASHRAAFALRGHAVDTLTAAGHLGVLGCESGVEKRQFRDFIETVLRSVGILKEKWEFFKKIITLNSN